MGATGTSGVVDAELVWMEEQSRSIADLESFLLFTQTKLLGCNCVDEPVADGRRQIGMFSLRLLDLVIVDVAVFLTLGVVFSLYSLVSRRGLVRKTMCDAIPTFCLLIS